jgi:Skp family chaperone for outer membrane proteins
VNVFSSARLSFQAASLLRGFGVVLACVGAAASQAQAQGPVQPARSNRPEHGIRVLDVQKVMQEHKRFKAQMEQLQAQVREFTTEQQRRQEAMMKLVQELQTYAAGSPERREKERQAEQMRSELDAEARLKRKEFLEQEAKIVYFTYKEVQEEVAHYCGVMNVSVVLAYTSEQPSGPNDPQAIMRWMANPVVAHAGIDITDTILRVLNREGSTGAAANPNVPRRN